MQRTTPCQQEWQFCQGVLKSPASIPHPYSCAKNLILFGRTTVVQKWYRRGERSWPFPSLLQKIERAKICGYISDMMARDLISKLPPEVRGEIVMPAAGEPYTFDATVMFYLDVKQTVELLVKQTRELRKRISYGNEELENAHYYTTSIALLEPVKILIQDVLQEKQAEEFRLKTKFGKENYKDIAPSSSPKSASAWDVGYTPDWWMKSPPSQTKMTDARNQVMNNKVKQQYAAFISKYGNDGVN